MKKYIFLLIILFTLINNLYSSTIESINQFIYSDRTDSILINNEKPNWQCGNYTLNLYENSKNKFNSFIVNITRTNFGHSFNAFFIKDSITNFNNWLFIEPQNDSTYTLKNLPNMSTITICAPIEYDIEKGYFTYNPVITFIYGFNSIDSVINYNYFIEPIKEETKKDTTQIITRVNKNITKDSLLTVYPNPFNNELKINTESNSLIEIYSLMGKRVEEFRGNIWKPKNISSGNYIIIIRNRKTFNVKLVTYIK